MRRRRDLLAQVAGEIDALLAGSDGAGAGHGTRSVSAVGPRAHRPVAATAGLATRLPMHPVLAPLWCAGWLLWVAVHLLSGNGSDYMSLGFAMFAAASAIAAGVEWTWLRGHVLWLLAVAANGIVVVPVLVSPMDADQTVTTRASVTVLLVALLVVAVRARSRGKDHDESSLVVFLALLTAAHGLLLSAAVASRAS